MKIDAIHNAVRSEWKTQIADPQSLWTIYENSDIGPPVDGRNYCKFKITGGDKKRITLGVKQYRTVKTAVAELYCAEGLGTGGLMELAKAIEVAFTDVTLSGVNFKTAYTQEAGLTKSGNEYQVNVYIPFDAEDY